MAAVETGCSRGSPGFIEQFVEEVIHFSSQYGNSSSISYTAVNLIGKPRVYPNYGDSHEAYSPRTYGLWWDKAPSASKPIQPQNMARIQARDFVDVRFETAVFPSQVSIYETLNPGSVVRIWAARAPPISPGTLAATQSWQLLYEGEPQNPELCSRIFQPTLRAIGFPTRVLRIELDHRHLDYHCQLDAVKLSGLVPSAAAVMATLRVTDLARVVPPPPPPSPPTPGQQQNGGLLLLRLPTELLGRILAELDMRSLARAARCCRRLRQLAADPLLYRRLDLAEQWRCADAALTALAPRCAGIADLRIAGAVGLPGLDAFLAQCGQRLLSLSLDWCAGVPAIPALAPRCPALERVRLRGCAGWPAAGALACLTLLNTLDLSASAVAQRDLLAVLAANPALRHLHVGSCEGVDSMDAVAAALATFCPALATLDAWKSRGWTHAGLRNLARLRQLRDIELGWSLGEGLDGALLLAGCGGPGLWRLGLAACRGVNDRDVLQLARSASGLQQLDLTGVKGLSESALYSLVEGCRRLQLLDVSFCGLPPEAVLRLRQARPDLQVKVVQPPPT